MTDDEIEKRLARFNSAGIQKAQKPAKAEKRSEDEDDVADKKRSVQLFKTMTTQQKMRLLSESQLDKVLPWHLEEGVSYHLISAGDVDSLTYLRHVVKDQHLSYVCLSTWCMAKADAEEMLAWVDRGDVDCIDFYVGEIFKSGYRGCIDVLDKICEKCGGRVARFRNHSKVMAFFGDRYSGVIEGSANVDTNPRTEQVCITTDRQLALFFKEYFDGINDFDGRYKDWKPLDIE